MLPAEVAWSFLQYQDHPSDWNYSATGTGYWFKEFGPSSSGFQRVQAMYNTALGGKGLNFNKVTAIYNPQLVY